MWQHAYQISFKGTIRIINLSALLIVIASCGGGGSGGAGDGGVVAVPPIQEDNGAPALNTTAPINPASISYVNALEPRALATMKYPATWLITFNSDPEVILEVQSPSSEMLNNIRDVVVLYKVDLTTLTSDSSPDDNGEVLQFEVVSEREITISGREALEVIVDAVEEGENVRFIFLSFELNDNIYTLAYGNSRNEFERKVEVIRHMASTLKIGQNIISGTSTVSNYEIPGKPAMASDGNNFLVVSCRQRTGDGYNTVPESLIGRIVRSDRSMSQEFLIESVNFDCRNKYEVVFDGNNYLVIYKGVVLGTFTNHILAKRVSRTGTLVDNVPITVTPAPFNDFEPTGAFDGGRSLVVWNRYGNINNALMGKFINANGTVTPEFTIANNLETVYPLPGNDLNIQLVYGNNQFMVIWSRYFRFNPHWTFNYPIYGQMLNLAGNLLLPQPLLIRSDPGTLPRYPQIVFDGNDYLVAWVEGVMGLSINGGGNHTVYARKISQSGAILNGNASQTGVMIAPPMQATGINANSGEEVVKNYLDVSFAKGKYLFLWQSPSHNQAGMYGVTASRDLNSIASPIPVVGIRSEVTTFRFDEYTHPNIAYSNNQSLVVWPSRTGFVEGWFNIY